MPSGFWRLEYLLSIQEHHFEGLELMHDDANAGVEPVKENQSQHGDEQTAGGGDQGFGNAAGDLGCAILDVIEDRERVEHTNDGAKEAQKRCQGDHCVEHPQRAI